VKFLSDPIVQGKLVNAKKLADVKEKDYDAIFYVGGHGPVIDLAVDSVNIKLAGEVSTSEPSSLVRMIDFTTLFSFMLQIRLFRQFATAQRMFSVLFPRDVTYLAFCKGP